ncbi:MAG: hypothetical protein JWN66_4982 [Sphingomonas bacterium]|nr:hypothetical protein [Sphingomonas bacterium]
MFLDLPEKYGVLSVMSPPIEPRDIDDALTVPAHGAEAMTVQILAQIRDSLSAINRKQDTISKDVGEASVRIARLEERNERVNRIEAAVQSLDARVDVLLKDKDRRDGATGIVGVIMKSPTLGWLVGAVITAWAVLTGKVHV